MKTFSKCSAAVVATAVWGLAVSAHAASIVTNGDFSAPTVSGSFSTNPPKPVPLPESAGVGFSMLAGFGGLAGLRKRLGRRAVIA